MLTLHWTDVIIVFSLPNDAAGDRPQMPLPHVHSNMPGLSPLTGSTESPTMWSSSSKSTTPPASGHHQDTPSPSCDARKMASGRAVSPIVRASYGHEYLVTTPPVQADHHRKRAESVDTYAYASVKHWFFKACKGSGTSYHSCVWTVHVQTFHVCVYVTIL